MVRETQFSMVRENNTNELAFGLTHQPCPTCGSSDALSVNTDGSTKCFSCGEFSPNRGNTTIKTTKMQTTKSFLQGKYLPLGQRKIHEDICKRYNYTISEYLGKPVHVASYSKREGIVGQKVRFENKDFKVIGNLGGFYGQHLFPNGGPKLTVTEGEIDCLSVAQVLGGGSRATYPVVSLPTGAQGAKKVFQTHLDWLSKFDEVILMFDSDEQGRKAAMEASQVLDFGKCKIAQLPLKDPNEMLVAGRGKELTQAFWDAKVWTPDDIVHGDSLYERLINPKHYESVEYPFKALQAKTRGLRKGEITTISAGTGIGKSQVCREICYHLMKNTDKRIGYIALEESVERTANSLIGLEMNELLHLSPIVATKQYEEAYKATVGNGRFWLYDHWGSLATDNLINKIKYMAKALEIDYIFLDHLSIVVSQISEGDERRLIDNTMTALRSLVEETNIGMVLVSHLKRPEGRGHEEGAQTSMSQLRGSAAIGQLSDMVIGLERNQQDEDNRNMTQLRVLKNRFTGDTGLSGSLLFNSYTGRMTETSREINQSETPPF